MVLVVGCSFFLLLFFFFEGENNILFPFLVKNGALMG